MDRGDDGELQARAREAGGAGLCDSKYVSRPALRRNSANVWCRDRGLDNFMIKGCTRSTPEDATVSIISDENTPHVHIAAIDNSLSFPHQQIGRAHV